MTTPSPENFDYTDDSVIARVSFDIPSQSVNDVAQLTQAMAAMRTQLEAIARSQADWMGYLTQMPDAIERANQVMREHITILERQSYVQNEIGGGRLAGGYGAGAAGGGGSGVGSYSTAAPPGYGAGPFEGQTAGMGRGGGGGGGGQLSEQEVAERTARSMQDPGQAANMQSARGIAVNPVLLAMAGGAVGRFFGRGKETAAASNPQKTSAERDSSAVPNIDAGGVPATSDDPDVPGVPHETAPDWQKTEAVTESVLNETKKGKNGRLGGIGNSIGNAIGNRLTPILGKKIGGAIGGKIGQALGTPAGMTSMGIAAGGMAFNAAQRIGERVTEFQQLGSVQGGDYMTGMKYEAQARIMALNPFITTEQARQAMQLALREGFRGDNYDTVQDFMIQNFKELGISMGQSMDIMKSQVRGLSEGEDQSGVRSNIEQTLNTMKELSEQGGASFPERVNQLQELGDVLKSKGFSSDSINRSVLGLQEGYGDSLALRDSATGIAAQVANSDVLNMLAGQQVGITGHLPSVTGKVLNEAGYDQDEIMLLAARTVAGSVSGLPGRIDRIGQFITIMKGYGVTLDFPQAEALYDKVTGEESPVERANNRVARQGKTNTGGGSNPSGSQTMSPSPADSDWNNKHRNYSPSENAAGVSQDFERAGRGSNNFAPSGNVAPPIPQAGMSNATFVSSTGTVTGNVTITVDQKGNVTAPPTIQLAGTTKSVNAGFGSAQMNNPPPGDPTFNHSYSPFPQQQGAVV